MKQITVAICGLGNRGKETYAQFQHLRPDLMKIVAVADIDPEKVKNAAEEFCVPQAGCYSSGEEMLEKPRLADVMIIATQDRQHVGHALPALEKGYHLLLEKPISPDAEECIQLLKKAHEHKRIITVCHVLRYTAFYSEIKRQLSLGKIGGVMTIQGIENVCYWHQAHSFVRGNWRNSKETSPMILQKSCHDMDIFQWLMDKECVRVSSFGDRSFFNAQNAPQNSTDRCIDGCKVKEDCPYDAEKIYVTNQRTGVRGKNGKLWPCNVLCQDPTEEKIYNAIKTGPYGRCVFKCDNDVVDHQVSIMEFSDKSTVDFTMTAFTSGSGRQIKLMGTKGDIIADSDTNLITINVFGKEAEIIDVTKLASDFSGHGGGDNRMMEQFLMMFQNGDDIGEAAMLTSIDSSIQSHIMALSCEYSRRNNGMSVDLKKFVEGKLYNQL